MTTQTWNEPTVEIKMTKEELQDIRIALMDYRSKWFDLYHKGLKGEMPENFSVEGAGLVYDHVMKLQERIAYFDDNFL
jgi:hypothetical protein